MKQRAIIFLLLFILVLRAHAQNVTVRAAFDTARIYIGDQINYTVTIDQPSDLTLTLKPLKDTLCRNIEILAGPETDSIVNGSRLIVSSKYLITSFDSGFYQVLPFYAESKNPQGIQRYYSDYSLLEVVRVRIAPADTTAKIFDIIEPYRAPLTIGEILPWVILGLAALVLAWFLFKLIKKLKREKTIPEVIINPDPAHIIAFRDLEKLRDEKLWQNGEVKLYYSRLTEILRLYLENRYAVYSLELTTYETLDELVKKGFKKDELYSLLKTILTGADLVKFAKYKPDAEENDRHFDNAWRFVDLTKVIEQEVKAESEAGKEVKP